MRDNLQVLLAKNFTELKNVSNKRKGLGADVLEVIFTRHNLPDVIDNGNVGEKGIQWEQKLRVCGPNIVWMIHKSEAGFPHPAIIPDYCLEVILLYH